MAKPGDVVEFRSGLHGLDAPRNVGILLSRWRRKGTAWVRLVTLDGVKEVKAEHLGRRAFKRRYDGDLEGAAGEAEALARLRVLAQQHAGGQLAEQVDDDLGRVEEQLWDATCDDGRDAWDEEGLATRLYGEASPAQLRQVRDALDRCRRPGTGRFETVGGRGDRWRPWTRAERERMVAGWQALHRLRQRLVEVVETDDGRDLRRVPLAQAGLGDEDQVTLDWACAAMVQYIEWDGVPDGAAAKSVAPAVPAAETGAGAAWQGNGLCGLAGTGAVSAFGMDLHRALGHLAEDWIASPGTSRSSNYIHFLLESGRWTPEDAVASLVRRHVNREPFFEHVPDTQAAAAADALPEPDAGDPGREDLRHLTCHTIDPPDARDFDDAVGLEPLPGGASRLWVHVADVSHYVRIGTRLDRHAKQRATSVYLPGRVLPMLPARISDHLCSLRDDGDRFALSAALVVDAAGRVQSSSFHVATIRVTENLSYADALARRDAGEAPFPELFDLAQRMRQHRRGLALETGELKVLLGATGFSALEKRADDATRMIETFMVAANEAVARHLAQAGVPLLYRCHPLPDAARAERFEHQLQTMGVDARLELPAGARPGAAQGQSLLDHLKAGGGRVQLFGGGLAAPVPGQRAAPGASGQRESDAAHDTPDDGRGSEASGNGRPTTPGFAALDANEREAWLAPFRAVVDALAAHPDVGLAEVATMKMLACMGRAYYAPENAGHFGLASEHYCHFTSPIRRYPDLVVHRNLKWLLAGRHADAPHPTQDLATLCDHCSQQERAADALERRIASSCLVLASVAQTGGGGARITGITPGSLFVTLDNGIEARAPGRELPGGPYGVDAWESMLFVSDIEAPQRFDRADVKTWRTWLDDESGELLRVRARLGDRLAVRLKGRNVADGKTEAEVVAWPGQPPPGDRQ